MRDSIRCARSPGASRQCASAALLLSLLAALVGAVVGEAQEADMRKQLPDGFRLFAGPRVVLASNRLQCTINSDGSICLDYLTSPDGNGGWFPTGTADAYIWTSGILVAGITAEDAGPWALDTAGIFNQWGSDARPLTPIYDSLDPDDLENWPVDAYVDDPEIFAPTLLDRKTASQHDSWVQYWDGDPASRGGLDHPMGLRITQRSMSWSYPSGNESVIYFVLEFENATDDAEFQRLNELAYFGGDDALPDAGWTYHDVYVAIGVDNDVGIAWQNFATAVLPFDMTIAYHGAFEGPSWWEYPSSVFYPPFFLDAPGIAGVKFLKSPLHQDTGEEVGLSMMSVFTIADDPTAPAQLWRTLSGNVDLNLGDVACNVPAEIQTLDTETTERSVCWIPTRSGDIRTFQASGPFTFNPGESSTLVFAHLVAPTVETMPDGSPSGIIANASPNYDINPPGVPSFHPGFASSRGCDPDGANCTEVKSATENAVTTIERGAGWVSYEGPPPSGSLYPPAVEHPSNRIDQFDVSVVPGSLLGRALVAQSVFENSFLLGFSPEPPAFYLVPGDENVTVIWEPSASETLGDPFYEVASDPESALYNPNYRQFDVEGYRIWRGTTRAQLELLTQFDFEDTRYRDYTCETVPPEEDVGATDPDGEPVLGFAAGDTCPLDQDNFLDRATDNTLIFNNGSPGGAPGAGVSREPVAVSIDTAVASDRVVGETRPLRDTGVPFVYIDRGVTNNFTYFYSVTAFDLNSMTSGPHTLRSTMVDQSTVPRAENSAYGTRFEASVILSGDDGVALDVDRAVPQPDADTGIFPGPQPPTNALGYFLSPPPEEVAGLLAAGQLVGRIDSVTAEDISFGCAATGGNALGACLLIHMTFDNGVEAVSTTSEVARPVWDAFGEPSSIVDAPIGTGNYPYDDARLAEFGIPAGAGSGVAVNLSGTFDHTIDDPAFVGQLVRRASDSSGYQAGGNRWFDGTEEVTPDPNRFIRVGHIEGVDSVWSAQNHTATSPTTGQYPASGQMQCFGYTMAILSRAADFQVTWGAGGTVTIRDITHNVPVDFKTTPQSSYGFMNTDGNGNGVIDWHDFDFLDVIQQATNNTNTFCEGAPGATTALEPSAQIQPVSLDGTNPSDTIPMTAAGNGFGLYINGERFIFVTDQLPAEGTVWTYRTYNGRVRATQDYLTEDPSGYELQADGTDRVPSIPGLQVTLDVVDAGFFQERPYELSEVHTVPDPYLATSLYDLAPSTKQLMFVNLPPEATIRIYSVTGILVDIVNHDDPTGGGRAVWDVRNRNNQFVASGVYFFHVVTPDGDEHVGKFTIVNRSSG